MAFCPNGLGLSKPTHGIPTARDTQAVSQILHLCPWCLGIWKCELANVFPSWDFDKHPGMIMSQNAGDFDLICEISLFFVARVSMWLV